MKTNNVSTTPLCTEIRRLLGQTAAIFWHLIHPPHPPPPAGYEGDWIRKISFWRCSSTGIYVSYWLLLGD